MASVLQCGGKSNDQGNDELPKKIFNCKPSTFDRLIQQSTCNKFKFPSIYSADSKWVSLPPGGDRRKDSEEVKIKNAPTSERRTLQPPFLILVNVLYPPATLSIKNWQDEALPKRKETKNQELQVVTETYSLGQTFENSF